jgi:hypothetical protein
MSYSPNEKLSTTSISGINSDNVISGGNWTSNTYTGSGEENNYAYVGVNLQVDESGTLFFDFSQDGSNWSSYPVAGFDVVSGINEVHTAWKGGRYMRPRFVGTGGRTFFRLTTYYSNLPLPLSAPLNQGISSDQDAQIVRSVGIGENPSGSYVNTPSDGLGFSTTTLLTNGQTFDSGVLDMSKYTQVQTDVLSDKNGTIDIEFSSESTGVDIVRSLSIPYVGGSGFKFFSAPAFTPFVKYKFTCNEVGQTDFYFDTKFTTKSISGQILGTEDFIATGMVANLGRNISVGKDPNGVFKNQKVDGVAFRTEVALGSGATYSSSVVSTEGYSQIETHLYSDVDGSLVGTWYNDESKTKILRTFTRPYAGDEVGTVSYFSAPVFGPYVEYEYTNGTSAQSEFFLDFHPRTKAISGQVLGMNDFIPGGVVANLGRSVVVGEQPNGNFRNDPANGVAFHTDTPLGATAIYYSPWIDTHGYNVIETFINTDVESAVDGIKFEFTDDLTNPITKLTEPHTFGTAEVLEDHLSIFVQPKMVGFRICYVNGTTGQSSFLLQTDLKTNGILTGNLDVTLTGKEDSTLTRSILAGKDGNGVFGNVSMTRTTNDAGVTNNLNVVSGARPSQLAGRTEVEFTLDGITADTLTYTVTTDKILYVTDIILTVDNGANTLGRLNIRDGLTVAGGIKIPLLVADPGSGGDSATLTYTHTFAEPMPFTTGVFMDEVTGTLTMAGVFIGYEE